MADALGEFALKLGIKTDSDSFEKSSRSVDKLTNNINRLVGALKIAAMFKGIEALSKVENESLRTAWALDISAKSLDTWKAAAKLAGVNAATLVQSMTNLDQKFAQIKIGIAPDQGLINGFSFLGLDYQNLAEMEADERIKKILQAAQESGDKKKAQAALNQILGQAGVDLYNELGKSNLSIDQLLTEAEKHVFTTDDSKQNAAEFIKQINGITASVESLAKLTGSKIGGTLTPFLEGINNFLTEHGDDIAKKITGFADSISVLTGKLAPALWTGAETAVKMIGDLADAINALLVGDWDNLSENLNKFFSDFGQGINKLLNTEKVGQVMQDAYDEARAAGANPVSATLHSWDKGAEASWYGKLYKYLKDQWNNIDSYMGAETISAGLTPVMVAPTQNEYSIVQNFTINGGGNNLPQEIKDAASSGVQNGLNFIHGSVHRQQQMPGSR